jgi:hypothetical protein
VEIIRKATPPSPNPSRRGLEWGHIFYWTQGSCACNIAP